MAAGDGLVSMAPTSIAYSGTSAGINADGGVDFSAVTSLSLNGVFTGDYDNYLIVLPYKASGGGTVRIRLRASGTDNSTASSYVVQALTSNNTTVGAGRGTSNQGDIGVSGTGESGRVVHIYGPALAQPTAWRVVSMSSDSTVRTADYANTHNQSTSYDGFTIYHDDSNITGNIHVFGYEE